MLKEKESHLKFNSAEDEIIAYIDKDKIEKIITNVLSNAFKFTPEGGRIEVTVTNCLTAERHNIPSFGGDSGVGREFSSANDLLKSRSAIPELAFQKKSFLKYLIVSTRLMAVIQENRKEPESDFQLQKN